MLNVHLYPSPMSNESRIFREARALADMGLFDRVVLVGVGQAGLHENEEIQREISIVRIGARKPNSSLLRKVLSTLGWSLRVYGRYRGEDVRCVNCHSVSVLPLSVALKYATGAKLVYDPHELETEAQGLGGLRKWFAKRIERLLIHQADQCVFVGRAIEQWYVREYGIERSTVVYNCPARVTALNSDYFRVHFKLPHHQRIFLYQGVIADGRGIKSLVRAFSGLADRAALVIMGYGPLAGWVAEQAKLHGNIRFHEAVPPDRLLSYTCAADFGLSVIEPSSLSYEYCMPNKLFEYLMVGKPVLVSPNVEQRDFVERHLVGEIAVDVSPPAIQDAARRLLDKPPGGYASGISEVQRLYCWEQQEKKMCAIYSSIFHSSSAVYSGEHI
ncbi:glycosyltransferase [Ramlibacter sp. AW1]|uniref:Glycosyltransferase n=1 Tax=Ramlibacter aurantiacus TaxID=2801330 RepID=A0A937D690_9BURK|nr:glycosyltransferase [Ramlibacter aurantiacus]MBL0419556.1 glycosyltransferase [Ramlibacter aurantiacus]